MLNIEEIEAIRDKIASRQNIEDLCDTALQALRDLADTKAQYGHFAINAKGHQEHMEADLAAEKDRCAALVEACVDVFKWREEGVEGAGAQCRVCGVRTAQLPPVDHADNCPLKNLTAAAASWRAAVEAGALEKAFVEVDAALAGLTMKQAPRLPHAPRPVSEARKVACDCIRALAVKEGE